MTLTASRPLSPAYPRELKTLGDHLRKRRLDLGLLQKDVARLLSVDGASAGNWENNRSSPKLQLIPKVIEFLGYVPFLCPAQAIGEEVTALRRLLGVRQKDLARQLGVDPSTLARWEKGESRPASKYLAKLSEFLITQLHGVATTC